MELKKAAAKSTPKSLPERPKPSKPALPITITIPDKTDSDSDDSGSGYSVSDDELVLDSDTPSRRHDKDFRNFRKMLDRDERRRILKRERKAQAKKNLAQQALSPGPSAHLPKQRPAVTGPVVVRRQIKKPTPQSCEPTAISSFADSAETCAT
jgi:hypothetical protein